MELGWCDVCLRVKSAAKSRKFYAGLGFAWVEGSDQEGWAVVTNGQQRLGLFEAKFMSQPVTLCFRGGDVAGSAKELAALGYTFESGPKFSSEGGATATLCDPDGNLISFDSAPGETMKIDPLPEE